MMAAVSHVRSLQLESLSPRMSIPTGGRWGRQRGGVKRGRGERQEGRKASEEVQEAMKHS